MPRERTPVYSLLPINMRRALSVAELQRGGDEQPPSGKRGPISSEVGPYSYPFLVNFALFCYIFYITRVCLEVVRRLSLHGLSRRCLVAEVPTTYPAHVIYIHDRRNKGACAFCTKFYSRLGAPHVRFDRLYRYSATSRRRC